MAESEQIRGSRFRELLNDLIADLQSRLGGLPREHLDTLRKKLFEECSQLEIITI
jgi:hypothetical protein